MATKIVNSLAGLPAEVTVKKLAHHSNYEELWITFPVLTAALMTAQSKIPAGTPV